MSDVDKEDLKTNINEKNEINEILDNNSHIIQKVKKNGSDKENESNNNAENEEKRNCNFSEIKQDSNSDVNKKIIENVDISNNNDIMETDEFEQYKNEKNQEELNYRTYKSEKKRKIIRKRKRY